MTNRVLLSLLLLGVVGFVGSVNHSQALTEGRLERLCQNTWVPMCVRNLKRKEAAVEAALVRVGFTDDDIPLQDLILSTFEAEKKFGVDARLLLAVAISESSLSGRAVSDKGAAGLFQILPETAQFLWSDFVATLEPQDELRRLDPVADAANVRLSVLMGAYYLARLRADFHGSETLALASYNVGPGKLKQSLREGEWVGSSYVRRVRDAMRALGESKALDHGDVIFKGPVSQRPKENHLKQVPNEA